MKLRRMKLVALAMSALMVTSALPMTAFAEDGVDFYEEVADEALVGESEDLDLYIEDEAEDVDFFEEDLVGAEGDSTTQDGATTEGSTTEGSTTPDLSDEAFTFDESYGEKGFLYDQKEKVFTYRMKGSKGSEKIDKANQEDLGVTPPTCKEMGYHAYNVWVEKDKIRPNKQLMYVEKTPKINHTPSKEPTELVIDEKQSCNKPGTGKKYYVCTVCHEKLTDPAPVDVTLDVIDHDYGEAVVTYRNKINVDIDEAGNATLRDKGSEGSYTVVTTRKCNRCGHEDVKTKDVKIPALEQAYVIVTEVKGVKNGNVLKDKRNTDQANTEGTIPTPAIDDEGALIIDLNLLEMEDCAKDGSYTVEFRSADNKVIATQTYTIPAHHYIQKTFEFKNADDLKKVAEKKENNKVVGYTNLSCAESVTYYEVEHCVASNKTCTLPGCSSVYKVGHVAGAREYSRKEVTLAPSDNHTIAKTLKADIEKYIKDHPQGVQLNDIDAMIEKSADKKFVKVVDNNPCEAGTASVEFYCKVCNKLVEKETIKDFPTLKRDHLPLPAERVDVVPATCTAPGSYTAVIKCKRCGKILDSSRKVLTKKQHTYEKLTEADQKKKAEPSLVGSVVIGGQTDAGKVNTVVDGAPFNGTAKNAAQGIHENFGVSAIAVTRCEVCGLEKKVDVAELYVVSFTAPKKLGDAGSIKLKAVYTADGKTMSVEKDFPWYSSINTYQAKTEETPSTGDDQKEEHKHTPGAVTRENVKATTCTESGEWDNVVKCTECGEVISTMHVVENAYGHEFGAWQTSKKATVFSGGTQKRTCARCKNVETKSLAKLPSIIKLNKTAVTVKVGKSATVKVSKWNLKDYIAPTAEGGVKASNKNASAFKTGSYTLKIKGKKAGSSTVTVKMKAGATATIKVTVKK